MPRWYGNVQTSARCHREGDRLVVSYVDLDMDVAKEPDRPVRLVDEDEFIERAAALRYPNEAIEQAWCAAAKLLRLLATDAPALPGGRLAADRD
jgi:protein associated with RNAse G/E